MSGKEYALSAECVKPGPEDNSMLRCQEGEFEKYRVHDGIAGRDSGHGREVIQAIPVIGLWP